MCTRALLRYPEVLASMLAYHTFICNDLASVHWFLVVKPPPLWQRIRHLDLSFCLPTHEYSGFTIDGRNIGSTRLSKVLATLAQVECLHDARLSFGIWNHDRWADISEDSLLSGMRNLKVKKNFYVELPWIPGEDKQVVEQNTSTAGGLQVERRPRLRYWMSPSVPPMDRRVHRIPSIPVKYAAI